MNKNRAALIETIAPMITDHEGFTIHEIFHMEVLFDILREQQMKEHAQTAPLPGHVLPILEHRK